MKIGSQAPRASAISASSADTIVVRGRDLCGELIGRISFTDHVWLLVTGGMPSEAQRKILDATLVAIAEHGLVPSVAAARMTLAAAPEALQGAVAAGILGCGSVILGSAEAAARFMREILAGGGERDLPAAVQSALVAARDSRRAVPGYGHPLHKQSDPRGARLLEIATEAGIAGRHVAVARLIERRLPEVTGKPLVMNVSGAIAAVMLDAGFPLHAVKGVPILARTASLIAHLLEERERPIGFFVADSGSSAVGYDGPSPPGFVPTA
ncbi:MAG TPA: citryl-CoA lyase [Steroidobacteraceae bacterium]|nr:citryl-CoA lyase [Steroidobacteraceae bacterium]